MSPHIYNKSLLMPNSISFVSCDDGDYRLHRLIRQASRLTMAPCPHTRHAHISMGSPK